MTKQQSLDVKEISKLCCLMKFGPINQNTLDVIKKSELFFNLPHYLNDPFEFTSKIALDTIIPSNTLGVCCFTASKLPQGLVGSDLEVIVDNSINNQLLWSHYADSHKGVCLVFDQTLLREGLKDIVDFQDVIYKKPDSEFPENIQYNLKSDCWKYENEIRGIMKPHVHLNELVRTEDYGFFVKYPLKALSSIVFGCRTSIDDIQPFYKSISDHMKSGKIDRIQLFRLKKSDTVYKLLLESMEDMRRGELVTNKKNGIKRIETKGPKGRISGVEL